MSGRIKQIDLKFTSSIFEKTDSQWFTYNSIFSSYQFSAVHISDLMLYVVALVHLQI